MCLAVKPVGEPDAVAPHVRFDERGWETGRWPSAPSYRAHPRLYRRRPGSCAGKGLLTEAGLKSPIFYSEDSAIDGAVMLEKLSAMQMEGIVVCLAVKPVGEPDGGNLHVRLCVQ